MELPCGVFFLICLSSLLHFASPTRVAPAPSPSSVEISRPKALLPIFASYKDKEVNSTHREICKKATYPSICISTTIPFFKGKYNRILVLDMEIQALTKGLELAREEVLTASKDEYCARVYEEAIDGAKTAREAVPTKGNVSVGLKGVLTLVLDCKDDIKANRTTSAIEPTNDMLVKLAKNCLRLEANSVGHRTS
ncbi:hypothetical protein Ancab_036138 [Ancistrocladus abbreviatus]